MGNLAGELAQRGRGMGLLQRALLLREQDGCGNADKKLEREEHERQAGGVRAGCPDCLGSGHRDHERCDPFRCRMHQDRNADQDDAITGSDRGRAGLLAWGSGFEGEGEVAVGSR